MHDASSWSFWLSWLESFYFWLNDVVNATVRHSVSFKCANDVKKNDPNIFLQQKVTILVSDWLPAVINKSTDARKLMSPSRNTLALNFLFFIMVSPVFDLI